MADIKYALSASWNALKGHKTFVLCLGGILTVVLSHYGIISPDLKQQLLEILGFGSGMALRHAIAQSLQE